MSRRRSYAQLRRKLASRGRHTSGYRTMCRRRLRGVQATATAPPRRGSPAPDERAGRGVALHRLGPAEEQVAGREAHDGAVRAPRAPAGSTPGSTYGDRRPRGARAARRSPPARQGRGRARPITTCRTAGADPVESPAEPSTSRGRPSGREHERRGHHRRQPPPRRVRVPAERREVLLAHHVVEVDPGARAPPRRSPRRSCT